MKLVIASILLLLPSVFAYAAPPKVNRDLHIRMAGWHMSIISMDEQTPNICLSTYMNDKFAYMDVYTVAMVAPALRMGGSLVGMEQATDVNVQDFAGGIRATMKVKGVKVSLEAMPLMVGRHSPQQEGAMLVSMNTSPSTPIVFRLGGSLPTNNGAANNQSAWLRSGKYWENINATTINDGIGQLVSSAVPFHMAVATPGALSSSTEADKHYLLADFAKGSGEVMVAFSKSEPSLEAIAKGDRIAYRNEVKSYYNGLMSNKVNTPEPLINKTFASALYNLEYNYVYPYGWNECIHHWEALWHMQHTPAADWIGQTIRTRDVNVVTARNLFGDGNVPQFMPSGKTRSDFGGSNQFYGHQVQHYWRQTADRSQLPFFAETMEKVTNATFSRYDTDGDGILRWGQQTGNQEDYVSTPGDGTSPTVEGINLIRTTAELQAALGNTTRAQQLYTRANQIADKLKQKLWQPELGRFAFYTDASGVIRPDGQYHTLIYPVIYGILDPLDSYTSIRYMNDRLTDSRGAITCSNNMPNHMTGTWGMQIGAAQQPWAAMGLAAVGDRNRTWQPLRAVGDWVWDANHRGAWPEISIETWPAYFSPPAGVYIHATVEALFGLKMNKPNQTIQVAPSFPDKWPYADITVADASASYRRTGNSMVYTVTTPQALKRAIRWSLPPVNSVKLLINDKPCAFKLEPVPDGVILTALTGAVKSSSIKVVIEPAQVRVSAPQSIAEGDHVSLSLTGAKMLAVEDREKLLSKIELKENQIHAQLSADIVTTAQKYGRLGQMVFSRRTLFVKAETAGGIIFWQPVNITVLPRIEAAPSEAIRLTDDGAKLNFVLRNNTKTAISGQWQLKIGQITYPFVQKVAARTEVTASITMPNNKLALLCSGDNAGELYTPDGSLLPITFSADEVFQQQTLSRYLKAKMQTVALPADLLVDDTKWREWRQYTAFGHWPWANSRPPMEALADNKEVTIPGLEGVSFTINPRKLIPLSQRSGKPSLQLKIGKEGIRKIYLLVLPLLDNHDTYISAARVDVQLSNEEILSRTYTSPGNLDWWTPQAVVGEFCTSRIERPNRFGLLPQLKANQGDWAIAHPIAAGDPDSFKGIPQPEFWANSRSLTTASAVFDVLEIDLGEPKRVESISLSALGLEPAMGLVAVSYEQGEGIDLQNTPYQLSEEYRMPAMLFHSEAPNALDGWKLEGNAFSICPIPSLFTEHTLNSMGKSGESATGTATSPIFTVPQGAKRLEFMLQGGTSTGLSGEGALTVAVKDPSLLNQYAIISIEGSHQLRKQFIDAEKLAGKQIRLVLTDNNRNTSYAWLGLQSLKAAFR